MATPVGSNSTNLRYWLRFHATILLRESRGSYLASVDEHYSGVRGAVETKSDAQGCKQKIGGYYTRGTPGPYTQVFPDRVELVSVTTSDSSDCDDNNVTVLISLL